MINNKFLNVVFLLFLLPNVGFTQEYFFNRDRNLLIETKWRYAYTMHVESGTAIHQAEDNYLHYVVFKYDSTYQQYLNGVTLEGKWDLDEATLNYPFRQVESFRITKVNNEALEIEFKLPNSKGLFLYHFNRADEDDVPFARRPNELPQVVVTRKKASKSDGFIAKAMKKRQKSKAKKKIPKDSEPFIQIELVGGGFYGGIDPVLRDYIVIKNDGRLVKEFKSKNTPLQVVRKDIPREELLEFVKWAETQDFFDFQRQYDCKNSICEKRKFDKPRPVPLRLSISYGNTRKMVTISIWGKDKHGIQYIDYPPQIDNIVDAIQRMASRV